MRRDAGVLTGDAVPASVLAAFDLGGEVVDVAPASEGHINRSWLVAVRTAAGARSRHLLQRINETVFPAPELVMANVGRVTAHLHAALAREGVADIGRRALRLIPTRAGGLFHRDGAGGVWRAYPFIEGTRICWHVTGPADAREIGRAFGAFQRLLASYDGPRLHETIPAFHDTARRVRALEAAVAADPEGRAAGAREAIAALLERRGLADVLPPLQASGAVPERIVHNDAKSSNVLLDERSGEALCVVDLDTVMPGTLLYDFGDLVRSSTSPTPEDEPDTSRIAARPELFAALAHGYLAGAGPILTAAERANLEVAGRLITYEQAVRFLTDHIEGDRYFRTAGSDHNLTRCRSQLALLVSLERQSEAFERILEKAV